MSDTLNYVVMTHCWVAISKIECFIFTVGIFIDTYLYLMSLSVT